ncbi:MAG: hypothetical protein QM669_03670 [Siphonobacter sp.]
MSLVETFSLPQVREFSWEHRQDDWQKLLLATGRYPDLPIREIAVQIQCRQKAKHKLPTWAANPDVLFFSSLSLEQSSSERAANFKAALLSGKTFADLTGGMGVDFRACSASFQKAMYCERNLDLAAVTQWNLSVLGDTRQIEWIQGDGMEWLQQTSERFDWLYLDPARRDADHQKVVRWEVCEPNVLDYKDLLLQKSAHVLIKGSPMMDIDLAIRQLADVAAVWVVAVEDEVKELLFHLTKAATEPVITAVNLLKSGQEQCLSFRRSEETLKNATYSKPLRYLYEPNAAVLKAGAFKMITNTHVLKIAPSSHLYTSETLYIDFPGRIFEIEAITKVDKKEVLRLLPEKKANLTVRNFPITVADLRKKLGIAEGGDAYLFATTDIQRAKCIIVCRKIN